MVTIERAEVIRSDIRKLDERHGMLSSLGEGYTVRQRIEYHELMVKLLRELHDIK